MTKEKKGAANTGPKILVPIAPELLDAIHNTLPPQPWETGTQQKIAAQLNVAPKLIQQAIKELILVHRCNRQFDGVVIDRNGFVLALDASRAAPHHKLGERFVRAQQGPRSDG